MLGLALSRAIDPSLFADDLGLTLDAWQAELLREQPRRALLNCSRQSGKTKLCAVLALYRAIFFADSLIVIISPSLRHDSVDPPPARQFIARHDAKASELHDQQTRTGKRLACSRPPRWRQRRQNDQRNFGSSFVGLRRGRVPVHKKVAPTLTCTVLDSPSTRTATRCCVSAWHRN